MRALLQQCLLPATRRADALLIAAEPLRPWGRETLIGRFGPSNRSLAAPVKALRRRHRRVIVHLGSESLLERLIELPAAAEREFDRVIGYEMDRLTPFTPAWLEATSPDGTARRIMLTTDATCRSGGTMITVPVCVVGVLLVAAIVTPFVVQSRTNGATESAIEALAPRVARVETLRKHLADGDTSADALNAKRLRVGNALQVLAAVTDIMPDDTWISDLSLRQGKLGLGGQSPAAARLRPALASDPSFHNPTFAAPVNRAPDGHADPFVTRTAP